MTKYRHKKPDVADFENPRAGHTTISHAHTKKKKGHACDKFGNELKGYIIELLIIVVAVLIADIIYGVLVK